MTDHRMRAVQISGFGGPEVLELVDREMPSAAGDKVVIKVDYCGICRHDLLTRAGAFPRTILPVVLGHQVSGTVVEIGSDVSDLCVGDRVITMPLVGCGTCSECRQGHDPLCQSCPPLFLGEDYDGGYADFVLVRERAVVRVPDAVPLAQAATLSCTLGTAYHALITRAKVKAGELVIVTGASGGVGLATVCLARMLGADVVGVISSDRGADEVRAAGAAHVIVSAERRFAQEVRARYDRQADIVMDVVGSATLPESIRAVRVGGRIVIVGNVTGESFDVSPARLILKEISLIGTKSCTRAEIAELFHLIASGALCPFKPELHALELAGALHRQLEEHGITGRAVIAMDAAQDATETAAR